MRILLMLAATVLVFTACTPKEHEDPAFVLVKGGAFINTKSNLYRKGVMVSDFYIGRYEITQKEWKELMGVNPSKFKGDSLPIETVSWYDCIEYCNRRSVKEGLKPYYSISKIKDTVNKSEFDSLKYTVMIDVASKGYRMPSETEWEYAASGGQKSKSYTYSGSDTIDDVAWYWRNSGNSTLKGDWAWSLLEQNNCQTRPVGRKQPNELGLYDMSGNVREWCEDWYEDFEITRGLVRVQRGGGWIGAEYRCQSSNRHSFEASGLGPDQGLRLCRSR
ncbi:formylglycine-generating enzyme family protein [Paradesertivirga mongoliensis]|uniref:Formylglycine-generating enzyme family protein n=1 Tax=Paradesertivirga mongoliensis TaxID=2100740 RepID=A0ABW4ZKT7_9SPHI|nr:SUMF1/EgtB/PvdO family nonheme iron enzyme [Pedobacter mongoliensis]